MDFNKVIDRRGTFCTQWDYIEDRFGKGNGDLTPFSISDTDFQAAPEILEEIVERTQHGIFGYSRWNHTEYKSSIQSWFEKRYETIIKEDWVIYAPSVLYSINLLLEILLDNDRKVMTHTPRYDGFTKFLSNYNLYEIELKEISKGNYVTDFEKIEEGFKDGVSAFLLCNPENPVGKVWTEDELIKLTKLCKKYKVYLISDDIHMDITRKKYTPVLKIDSEYSIILSSTSKTFNIPSLGGSYGIIPQDEIREKFLHHLKNVDSVSSPTIFSVLSTITAYNKCEYWVNSLNEYIDKNCEYVMKELDGYKGLEVYIPEATYLMWIGFKNLNISQEQFQKALIEEGKVAIMSGEMYGDKHKIRLNIGCPMEKVKVGVDGIKRAIEKLMN